MLESIIEEPGIMKFQEYMEEEGKKKVNYISLRIDTLQ